MRCYWSAGLVALFVFAAGCHPGTSTVNVTVKAVTEVTSQNPDGTSTTNFGGDPALVGPKDIVVVTSLRNTTTVKNIIVSFWRAGDKAHSQSTEKAINQTFNPGPGGENLQESVKIPGSEGLGICDAMYYMVAVSYVEASTPGTFVSQAHLILPTETIGPDGTIRQAQCVAPPGPEQ
jgi:hypothetical protein